MKTYCFDNNYECCMIKSIDQCCLTKTNFILINIISYIPVIRPIGSYIINLTSNNPLLANVLENVVCTACINFSFEASATVSCNPARISRDPICCCSLAAICSWDSSSLIAGLLMLLLDAPKKPLPNSWDYLCKNKALISLPIAQFLKSVYRTNFRYKKNEKPHSTNVKLHISS